MCDIVVGKKPFTKLIFIISSSYLQLLLKEIELMLNNPIWWIFNRCNVIIIITNEVTLTTTSTIFNHFPIGISRFRNALFDCCDILSLG